MLSNRLKGIPHIQHIEVMHSLYIFPTYEFMGYLNDVKPTVTYLSFTFDSSIIDSSIINDSLTDKFCRIICQHRWIRTTVIRIFVFPS